MAGVIPAFREPGPVTFTINAAATIVGGMIVESDAGTPALIRPASAGSLTVVGVATNDGAGASVSQVPTVPGTTSPAINAALLPSQIAVAMYGVWPVTYAAATVFGARQITAANGQATPSGATPDARTVIGTCVDSAGEAGANVGLLLLNLS